MGERTPPAERTAVAQGLLFSGQMSDFAAKVLVVEDEPLLRRLLLTALEARGHRVETCNDGEEAVQKLERGRFDLVVTDYRMPRMTGLDLIRILQSGPERIAIVLTSSDTLEDMKIGERDLIGVEFLRKPFGLTDLYSAVQRALKTNPPG